MPNPTPGTILGAYRVEGQLGAGSMGEVFRAVDTGLERRVAIKLLSEKHRDSPELRKRFVREGRAVAAISHPNVVQVFATGSFDDRPYIAMEFLDGIDLGSAVEKQGALSALEAAHAVLDAAQGLSAASKAGLIHRDVKPSNLVRLPDGKVKVTDFGLAKPVEPTSGEPALTAMGVVVGTPDYIAPEQARGEAIDERVDIYALGGTLYYLLTGVPPFRTGRPADDKYLKVVARHLRNPPPDARERNPSADPELSLLALQLMSKSADERPSYAELVARVTQLLARLDPGSVPELVASTRERSRPNISLGGPSAPLPPPAAVSPAYSDVDDEPFVPPRSALPVWLLMVTLASIALFVAGLVTYLGREDTAPPKPATAGSASGSGSGSASPSGSASASPSGSASGSGSASATLGMILVKRSDGSPWFYVDAEPITAAVYQTVFGDHTQPGAPTDPAIDVSYDEARSFAKTRAGRLLRSDEWDAASVTPGVRTHPGTLEWVESPEGKRTVRQHGKTLVRPDNPQHDVSFRVAKDL
ncbi:MAG TPA: serine/threonine-protein kinase [Kofleriaceae bacterium]|nr:serine/threonine-protein kinase [Kofleriaceae bacterium]